MQLYLMRHGIAEPGGRHQPDAERMLTPGGQVLMQQQAQALAQLQPNWSAVLSSTYVRAQQTRDIIARAVGLKTQQNASLRPGCSLAELEEALLGFDVWPLVVFHQPSIGQIVYDLTGARVPISPGTVIGIDLTRWTHGGGMLTFVYRPEDLATWGRAKAR
ncbi:MAG: phosphohistidine phosphatase SixA [Rhodothermales bacterium]